MVFSSRSKKKIRQEINTLMQQPIFFDLRVLIKRDPTNVVLWLVCAVECGLCELWNVVVGFFCFRFVKAILI